MHTGRQRVVRFIDPAETLCGEGRRLLGFRLTALTPAYVVHGKSHCWMGTVYRPGIVNVLRCGVRPRKQTPENHGGCELILRSMRESHADPEGAGLIETGNSIRSSCGLDVGVEQIQRLGIKGERVAEPPIG